MDGAKLVAPFEMAEIKAAVASLDRTSAPGPDGLGPGFYQAAWELVSGDVMRLMEGFYDNSVNLSCINRAHVVLLPKAEGVLTPGGF